MKYFFFLPYERNIFLGEKIASLEIGNFLMRFECRFIDAVLFGDRNKKQI